MSRPIIFDISTKEKIEPNVYEKEKKLQKIVEDNMKKIFGIIFLHSEYSFNDALLGRGRIDSIGIDKEGRPVIFEYKLNENENVINQSLFYMDWLKNHLAEFELLVLNKLGEEKKRRLLPDENKNDLLKKPRAICIAKNFSKYDRGAVNQMNADIELFQYYVYGKELNLIAFELVNSIDNSLSLLSTKNTKIDEIGTLTHIQNIYEHLEKDKKDFVDQIIFKIQSISDNVSFVWKEKHANFKTTNIFASLVINKKDGIKITLPIDYKKETMNQYHFIRDVKNVGHYGVGNVEAKIQNEEELEIFMMFIRYSYERNA